MREAGRALRVVRASAANAMADLRVVYTPVTWTFGWLGRIVMQVVFFALIGVLLDSPERLRFLFVGNAVMVTALEVMMCVASSSWERKAGTLPLLVAAPTRLLPVFVGRSVQWLPSGVATASVALFAVGPAFGVTWTPWRAVAAVGCLVVVAVSTYGFGLAVGAAVLGLPSLRNVSSNVANTVMMLICGVMVPVSFWPGWVGATARALPLTHGVAAVRGLAGDAAPGEVLRDCGLALGVGAAWFLVAGLLFERFAAAGRRTGSIDFAD
ncbi:hypothetical protein Val02_04870 [Virgisporangium aliadipatigenens]|uniref:ABC-2 type transporter transmembrane domain-containing protein n=1 Tax=Virgisporangium aliadipatigenens TaxID=741659 RepID=A0A8J4DN98_9ACTN|nr:ABC transporter permease [Virgisporangium aliadipatigenens]GIJ43601.1 hypothetical protein Val02_04870 [Virgisporangium aliadipatigenens]